MILHGAMWAQWHDGGTVAVGRMGVRGERMGAWGYGGDVAPVCAARA
jgi:hypothetical protein